MSSGGTTTRAEAAKRANLAGLLFCFLSILSVCLTIFNLYLFYWIWSSLSVSSNSINTVLSSSGAHQSSVGQARDQDNPLPVRQLNLFDQLELLRDENKLTFPDKLLAKKPIQVHKIRQINEGATLRLSSASEVQFKINDNSRHANLVVSAKRGPSLEFAEGFVVRSDGQNKSHVSLECRPERNQRGQGEQQAPFCHLRAKQIELSRPEGVDFGALKSIQTGRVRTRRVHSSLNKLQLMTGSGRISFESLNDQIHLRALDLVSLGSRNSSVIIKAKTIKLGDLMEIVSSSGELDDNGELAKQHKLCACLKEEKTNSQLAGDKEAGGEQATNNGLVFAIQNHLRCSQFTETKCKR